MEALLKRERESFRSKSSRWSASKEERLVECEHLMANCVGVAKVVQYGVIVVCLLSTHLSSCSPLPPSSSLHLS